MELKNLTKGAKYWVVQERPVREGELGEDQWFPRRDILVEKLIDPISGEEYMFGFIGFNSREEGLYYIPDYEVEVSVFKTKKEAYFEIVQRFSREINDLESLVEKTKKERKTALLKCGELERNFLAAFWRIKE